MSQVNAACDIDPIVLEIPMASYKDRNPNEVVSTIVERNRAKGPGKVSRLAQVKAERLAQLEAAAKNDSATISGRGVDARPAEAVVALPKAGTVNAREFFCLTRRAKDRTDRINAIAAYVGYDAAGNLGEQELRARFAAQREISGVKPLSQPVHTAEAVIGNVFVSGMPNERAKRLADLQGREALTAERMKEHSDIGADASVEASERHYHRELAKVEALRLSQIQKDIATLLAK